MKNKEIDTPKCSKKDHKEITSIKYCQECKIYMCKDCDNFHSNLFSEHHLFNLDQKENIEEIFTGLCKEQNHNVELEFYCKTHNQLCCAKCIASIKEKGNGEHKECDVCFIEEYEEEKKNKLNENIKNLEDILLILEKSIIDFK